jgi:O-antigen/teichoic acid export membrane protein
MINGLPFGVKYARAINLVSIVLFILIALCLVAIAIPNFIRGAQEAGKEPNPAVVIVFGLIAFTIVLVPAFLLVILNKALLQLKETARVWQIILSCLFLLAFPLGTILYGVCLYFMLFDVKTKEVFRH